MEQIIKLNEQDIVQIISNYFNVDRNKVTLKVDMKWEGYGPMEHKVHKATATVKIDTAI